MLSNPSFELNSNTQSHIYKPHSFFITDNASQRASPRGQSNDVVDKQSTVINGSAKDKFNSSRDKRRKILEKLYGITEEHVDAYNNAKKKKYLPLLSYQNNILSAYGLRDVVIENAFLT